MISIVEAVQYAQVASPLIFTAGVVIAARAISFNIIINKRNKRADAIFHCNARYDEIYKFKTQVSEKPKSGNEKTAASEKPNVTQLVRSANTHPYDDTKLTDAGHYYARYWGLKSDEFDYWLAELIDIDTIANWAFLTVKGFRQDHDLIPGVRLSSFRSGWKISVDQKTT